MQGFSNFFGWWPKNLSEISRVSQDILRPSKCVNTKLKPLIFPFFAVFYTKFFFVSNLATFFGHLATLKWVATPSLRTAELMWCQCNHIKWLYLSLAFLKWSKKSKTLRYFGLKMNHTKKFWKKFYHRKKSWKPLFWVQQRIFLGAYGAAVGPNQIPTICGGYLQEACTTDCYQLKDLVTIQCSFDIVSINRFLEAIVETVHGVCSALTVFQNKAYLRNFIQKVNFIKFVLEQGLGEDWLNKGGAWLQRIDPIQRRLLGDGRLQPDQQFRNFERDGFQLGSRWNFVKLDHFLLEKYLFYAERSSFQKTCNIFFVVFHTVNIFVNLQSPIWFILSKFINKNKHHLTTFKKRNKINFNSLLPQ